MPTKELAEEMRAAATRIVTFVLQPIRYMAYRIYAIQSGYEKWKCGRVEFWGDKAFVNNAAEALELLAAKDSTIATSLKSGPRFTFVQYPQKSEVYLTSRVSAIDESFSRWGAAGIAAYVIYAIRVAQSGGRRWSNLGNVTKVNQLFAAARSQTADWLERHDLPKELVMSFRQGGGAE
jgi:hypothetical protein